MGFLRARPTVIAILALAAVAFASLAAESHRHEPLPAAGDHLDLPTFSIGHHQPDRSLHIEGATQTETSACIACLHEQRQRAFEPLEPSLGSLAPAPSALGLDSHRKAASGAHRLPTSRAPPAA